MAETATAAKAEMTTKPTWKPGQHYVLGQPIPEGAIVVAWEGGQYTLEVGGPPDFDPNMRDKVMQQIDLAYTRCFAPPSDENPQGVRPYILYVNRAFRKFFQTARMWGELEPPCEVEIIDGNDKRFDGVGAVRIAGVKARFSTAKTEEE